MMQGVNYDEFLNKILQEEKLNYGDKINLQRLSQIAEKYSIDRKELAIKIFKVKSAEYSQLISESSDRKNIVILREMKVEKDYSQEEVLELRQKIIREEGLQAGVKINAERLKKIAEKYSISTKVLAIRVFEVSSSEYSNQFSFSLCLHF